MFARASPTAVDRLRQTCMQDVHHQCRFTAAADTGHADQLAKRERDIDILQVVLLCAANRDELAVAWTPHFWYGDVEAA